MRDDDPYAGFLFRLSLGDIEIGGFCECTGLDVETKVFEYREGGVNTHALKFPEQGDLKNLLLKRGLTSSYELFDWFMDVARGSFSHANQRSSDAGADNDTSRTISIALIDPAGETRKEWVLRRAFPVRWSGPEFKATDNSVAFETIELAHEGIEKVIP